MSDVPTTMRAVRVHETGGAEALRVESIPVPRPRAGEALVRVEASGVNFVDVYKRSGLYEIPLPATLGEEGAGTVVATGPDVHEVVPGERVAWASVLGSYAEYAVVPAWKLVPLPPEVSVRVAAAVMLQGMTAHYLATSTWPLRDGDRCLVHAAAGGVGLLLVQIAKRRGAWVVGTAGSDEKAALARAAGADEVIVYTRDDFVAEVRRLTEQRGVQVVYDSVGRSTFLSGLDVLAPHGLSMTQYNVLRILRGAGTAGLCRNEIGERLISRTPDVTRLLDRMETAGLVSRARSTEDRRLVNTVLTAKGRRLVDELDDDVARAHEGLLGHLTKAQLRTLVDLLALARSTE